MAELQRSRARAREGAIFHNLVVREEKRPLAKEWCDCVSTVEKELVTSLINPPRMGWNI